jgi:hypothetical protein
MPMQSCHPRPLSISLMLSLTLLCACGKQAIAPQAAMAAPDAGGAAEEKDDATIGTVKLTPDQVAKLGLTTRAAAAVSFVPAKQGFGVVLSHDAIAQAVADVATAQATVRQSQAVLARIARLAGTPGAESAEAREGAVRQEAVDAAALRLAAAKASATLGQHPPWSGHDDSQLPAELAQGRSKLLRVTFPLGTLRGPVPSSLRVSRLDSGAAGERWTARAVWEAPADSGLPGRSVFALLQHTDAAEGERLLVWSMGDASAGADSGVLVPPTALVVSDGKYWCYVERQPGLFARVLLDIGRPMADGYFIAGSIKPGDAIVTSGAGLLLAHQTNPNAEAE